MVPEGWVLSTIEKIAEVASGGTPSRKKPAYWNGDIPWVTTAEVSFGTITTTEQRITPEGLKNSSAKIFPKNTILMAMYGQGKTRGKVAKLGIEAATNQACAAILMRKGTDTSYYCYFLESRYGYIRNMANTGGQENLSAGIVKSIKVPIPPLPEQKKIAEILSTWDQAIDATERLLDNSRQRKKALMQQLLTGKKRLPRFEGEWGTKSIRQMGKVVSGGTPDTSNAAFWGGDIKWLTPTDITSMESYLIYDTHRKLTQKGVDKSSASLIPEGALCVCTRASVGLMAVSTTWITTNQGFKTVVPIKYNHVIFLYYLFSFNRSVFVRYSNGSTFLELSKKDFEKISFKCPAFSEQQAIADILSTADEEITSLSRRLEALQQEKKALMQQLLTGKRRVKVDEEAA